MALLGKKKEFITDGQRRAKLIITAAAVTKKGLLSLSPSVGNRSSDTQRVFLAGLVLACFLLLPSSLRPPLSWFFPRRPKARNRNESRENHALRINLSLLGSALLSALWEKGKGGWLHCVSVTSCFNSVCLSQGPKGRKTQQLNNMKMN